MITSPEEYNELLYKIQDYNRTYQIIPLPKEEPIYEIDLNSRTIQAPEFLSVEYDHNAETIYFKCDRYFDCIDLAREDIALVVQYENANPKATQRGYVYLPPYIDVETFKAEGKIAFPWVIEGQATAYSGTVTFSVRFYKLNQDKNYEFNLNTLASNSRVLHGMDLYNDSENFIIEPSIVEDIYAQLSKLNKGFDVFWIDLEGE